MSNESLSNTQISFVVSTQSKAALMVTLSGILYGFFAFFGTKILRENFSIPTMLFWRFFIAGLWMFIWESCKQKKIFARLPAYPEFILPVLLGAIFYGIGTQFYFLSSEYLGTGLAMVIFFSYPVFVALVVLIKNNWRMNRYTVLSLMLIVFGLVMLKGGGKTTISLAGILFGLIAAFGYGMFVLGSKRITHNMASSHATIFVCIGCAAMSLLISLASPAHSIEIPASIKTWGYVSALGVIATAIPIQLLQEGLKHMSSLKASIISVLEPVVTLIVGVLLLSERVSLLQLVGVLIILVGAIVIQFARE